MFRKGDLVRHPALPSWGIGMVVKTAQDGNLIVRFEQGGQRLLHPGLAGLTRVPKDELRYLVIREVRMMKGRPIKAVTVIPVVRQG